MTSALRNVSFCLLATAVAACASAGDDSSGPENAMSEAALSSNEQTAFNFFVAKGLTTVQAAGVIGNLMQESGMSPTIAQIGGGPGRGIAQWSVGGRWDTSKNDNVTSYASQHGESRTALNTQLNFIWFELTTFSGYGLASLRAATTIDAAVAAFQDKYEVCGQCDSSKRITFADQALSAFGKRGTGCFSGTLNKEMPDNACVQSKFDNLWYQCDNGFWVDRFTDPDACNGVHPL